MALLLGYDVGSSSIKATLIEAGTGKVLASATSPEKELEIIAKQIGWACQCGERLPDDLECIACGKTYTKKEEGLRENER